MTIGAQVVHELDGRFVLRPVGGKTCSDRGGAGGSTRGRA